MTTWTGGAGRCALAVALVMLALAPRPAAAAAETRQDAAPLEAGVDDGVVVVVQSRAEVAGTADVLVVVQGTATLTGARVGEVVVIQGRVLLEEGTVVTGDVRLVDATLVQGEGTRVQGRVTNDSVARVGRGLLAFGLVFALGAAVVMLVSGLAAAAVAPHGVRAVGALMTDRLGPTVLAALVVWVGGPAVAVAAFVTFVGIPLGLAVVLVLLPALGFLGYLVAGIWLGDYALGRLRGSDEAWHPYRAALVGVAMLLVAGWVPVLGSLVTPAAAFLGSGALALHAWDVARRPRQPRHPVPAGA